jgi:1,4-dihydroxy-2-naphthoate octaprenyltransferase
MSSINLKLIKACRPQTLIIGATPILLVYYFAKAHKLPVSPLFLILCFAIALCLQMAANLFNDAFDGEKGADISRVGDQRLVASGLLSAAQVKKMAISLLFISFILSLPFFRIHFMYIPLCLSALLFAYVYTGSRYALAYNGLGELFAFLYFGIVATIGTAFAVTSLIPPKLFCMAINLGLGAAFILGLNNLRDLKQDKTVGKNTLAVILGKSKFKWFLVCLISAQVPLRYLLFKNFTYMPLLLLPSIAYLGLSTQVLKAETNSENHKNFKIAIALFLLDALSSMVIFTGGRSWD